MLTSTAIRSRAREIGFDLCGVAPAEAFPELTFLREWIDRGYAGTMAYLPRSAERRSDVRRVMPSARAVIMTGAVYNAGQAYSTERHDPHRGEVARYAWSQDYHDVLGRRLESLIAWMREQQTTPFEARAYVDTGPVQERIYAQYAGLGWIGKNSCVINPDVGSWMLLGAVVCSLPLEPDAPALDQCGTCTLCLEACPTQAFVAPYVLDATRCLSYLTIEYRGSIPEEHRERIGNHLFGCDICQEVCPWNGAPVGTSDPSWSARADVSVASLIDLWRRCDEELETFIGATPMTRIGVKGLRRNLAVALGNSADPRAVEALGERGDRTASDPLVVEHVEWARAKLESGR
ncbi:MAG TPA: tRNA epoxyqueuosine(34) reductase QueG [Vicinamibacterales bacterium]|nr:tRNA epoxyqueuosine(34) reductase QueG [Vicinamibacterales bacterium]